MTRVSAWLFAVQAEACCPPDCKTARLCGPEPLARDHSETTTTGQSSEDKEGSVLGL